AIGGQDDLAIPAAANETEAALAVVQFAVARAYIALEAPVFEKVPIAARLPFHDRLFHGTTAESLVYIVHNCVLRADRTTDEEHRATRESPPARGGGLILRRKSARASERSRCVAGECAAEPDGLSQGADRAARRLHLFRPCRRDGLCRASRSRGRHWTGACRACARDRHPDGHHLRNAAWSRAGGSRGARRRRRFAVRD